MPTPPFTPTATLSAAQSRRVFLAAQGMARRRQRKRASRDDFRAYLERQGVLQLDTVNVLARAHYMPLFSRLGPYDTGALDGYLWGSGETIEQWGHEAAVMPRDLLPTMHRRMTRPTKWRRDTLAKLEAERPGLLVDVRASVEESGPVVAADLEHLSPVQRPRGDWWDSTHVKLALEHLFITGLVAGSRTPRFERTYDSPMREWGVPAADNAESWALASDDAIAVLADRALTAVGVGTAADVADHFRLPVAETKAALETMVAEGRAEHAAVEGWKDRAYLAATAQDPGKTTGVALLSPFDPVAWFRPRLERMFGMEYRIEIYTPEAKRQYGYYTLPLLLGDQVVGRFDLKADRKASALLVRSSWREEMPVKGARRRTDDEIADAAWGEFRLLQEWLGLERVEVEGRGNLAPQVASRHGAFQD